MGGDVHDDHGFFTLRFFRSWRFFNDGLRLRLDHGFCGLEGLLRRLWRSWLNLWRSGLLLNRLRLMHRLLWRRLMHRLRLNGLLRRWLRLLYRRTLGMLRLYRYFRRLLNRLTRLCRRIRRLVLVLRRLARSFMLLWVARGMIHAVNTNFTDAFVCVNIIVIRVVVAF
ncbi:hypothetical protein TUM17580_18690 [Citrobacter farmeri]|nr:hypothetical protein TUM17580_18690 [Citrobacter farmeri]